MCVNTELDCKTINRSKLGRALRSMLANAKVERRLVCGLIPAITYLEKSPDDVIFCVLPETRPGDAATHIQAVLLQAFCYENYIPVIQVDSSKKLANYCGITMKDPKGCNCAIITGNTTILKSQELLTDFYQCTLDMFPKPIIELPI